ncbi:phosphonate transport system substrate-binding protein [uncultured Gammaproteobacteria bacterium]
MILPVGAVGADGTNIGPAPTLPPAAGMKLGIVPYLSVRSMMELFNPLREELQQRLGVPVTIVTETDYGSFIAHTALGGYDLVLTGSHMARLAQLESGYVPVFRTVRELSATILVDRDGPVKSLADLRGRTMAMPDPLAQVSIMARAWLRSRDIIIGRDLSLVSFKTHNNAAMAVLNQGADSGAVSSWALQQMPADLRDRLRILATTEELSGTVPGHAPAIIFLANGALGQPQIETIKTIVMHFINETEAGRASLGVMDRDGVMAISDETLRSLDAFIPDLKASLAEK